jgi:hypothetical protein
MVDHPACLHTEAKSSIFKEIVSRVIVVCFLVSFDRSEVCTHAERVRLLLKSRFRVNISIFVSRRSVLIL